MITQQQLTDRCTPEIIKKMVGLAEGFECAMEDPNYLAIYFKGKEAIIDSPLVFSTLIHRAVEGYNKQYPHKYVLNCVDNIVWFDGCIKDSVEIKNYSPSSLTHAECAMLHCLQEVIK